MRGEESELLQEEMKLFGKESQVVVLSPTRMRWHLLIADPKTCTEFVTSLLKWLNSEYVEVLKEMKKFDKPVLS